MNARRLDLDLSWKQLAQQAGISDVSLRNFRKGRSEPGPLSTYRLEVVLGWAHGSIEAVLAGGEPTLASQATDPGTFLRPVLAAMEDALADGDVARALEVVREAQKQIPPPGEHRVTG